MAISVQFQEQVDIPLGVHSLADFRHWALSEGFPGKGRIDFVQGRIGVSVVKDTQRLPIAYFQARVREFWLADARREQPVLDIHHRGPTAYVPAQRDAQGFQPSAVIGCRFRLDASWEPQGHWWFDLRTEV